MSVEEHIYWVGNEKNVVNRGGKDVATIGSYSLRDWSLEMAQGVKALTSRPERLRSISRTHMVERTNAQKLSSDLQMNVHARTNKQSFKDARVVRSTGCFQRTRVQFPAPTWQCTTTCNPSSRASDALSWLLQAPGMHAVHRHTRRQNTQAYKIKIKVFFKN